MSELKEAAEAVAVAALALGGGTVYAVRANRKANAVEEQEGGGCSCEGTDGALDVLGVHVRYLGDNVRQLVDLVETMRNEQASHGQRIAKIEGVLT